VFFHDIAQNAILHLFRITAVVGTFPLISEASIFISRLLVPLTLKTASRPISFAKFSYANLSLLTGGQAKMNGVV